MTPTRLYPPGQSPADFITGPEEMYDRELAEADKIVDQQFKAIGKPQWCTDYKPPKRRQVAE